MVDCEFPDALKHAEGTSPISFPISSFSGKTKIPLSFNAVAPGEYQIKLTLRSYVQPPIEEPVTVVVDSIASKSATAPVTDKSEASLYSFANIQSVVVQIMHQRLHLSQLDQQLEKSAEPDRAAAVEKKEWARNELILQLRELLHHTNGVLAKAGIYWRTEQARLLNERMATKKNDFLTALESPPVAAVRAEAANIQTTQKELTAVLRELEESGPLLLHAYGPMVVPQGSKNQMITVQLKNQTDEDSSVFLYYQALSPDPGELAPNDASALQIAGNQSLFSESNMKISIDGKSSAQRRFEFSCDSEGLQVHQFKAELPNGEFSVAKLLINVVSAETVITAPDPRVRGVVLEQATLNDPSSDASPEPAPVTSETTAQPTSPSSEDPIANPLLKQDE